MVENNIQIRIKENPVLLDKVIQDIQATLKERLLWLNNAFGKAHKLVGYTADGHKFIYPAAYIGNSEYISLLPNDNYGNFCWFDIYDPQEITQVVQSTPQFSFSGAIIFWYNLNSIYADADVMYTEEIKDEIVRAITTPGVIKQIGRIEINRIYEHFENIYKGYSYQGQEGIQGVDKQFFMHPYAGIRIEFQITTRELCQHYIK
jgi:hypothetical protein